VDSKVGGCRGIALAAKARGPIFNSQRQQCLLLLLLFCTFSLFIVALQEYSTSKYVFQERFNNELIPLRYLLRVEQSKWTEAVGVVFSQQLLGVCFRYFNEFLMAHNRDTALQVRGEYLDTMGKIYYSYFKDYYSKLLKMQASGRGCMDGWEGHYGWIRGEGYYGRDKPPPPPMNGRGNMGYMCGWEGQYR